MQVVSVQTVRLHHRHCNIVSAWKLKIDPIKLEDSLPSLVDATMYITKENNLATHELWWVVNHAITMVNQFTMEKVNKLFVKALPI